MPKPGRPFVYLSDEEKPVTVSLRIPRDLYEQAQRYVGMRLPMTMTELLLDGLRLRLETPTDPRDLILSDDNTVMRQLQEMVDAAVQAALAKERGRTAPVPEPLKQTTVLAQAQEAVEPTQHLPYDDNTVLQVTAPRRPGRQSTIRRPILDLLQDHQEGLTAVELKVHLGLQKPIGDTLAGMVRAGLLEKDGTGQDVRYTVKPS